MQDPIVVQPIWADPVRVGVCSAGIANGGNDGTAEWGEDGCRQQPYDKGPISEPPSVPANGQ